MRQHCDCLQNTISNGHYFAFKHLVKIWFAIFADATWAPFGFGIPLVWQDIAVAYDTHGRSFMDCYVPV
jgi:hypothetical protein